MAIAAALEAKGASAEQVFARAGMDFDALSEQEKATPGAPTSLLWHEAVKETGDLAFGLTVSRCIHSTTFHSLGFRFLCCKHPLELLACLVRFERLISNVVEFKLNEVNDGASNLVELMCLPAILQLPPSAEAIDATTSLVVRSIRRIVKNGPQPISVTLSREQPESEEPYSNLFKCPITYNASENKITWLQSDLLTPITSANDRLAKQLDVLLEQEICFLYDQNISSQLQSLLLEQLPNGEPTQDKLATQLNMSLRTLQRRLAKEKTSYNILLENTRVHLALKYLSQKQLSLGEISDLLGFRDHSSFTRWFRLSQGVPPINFKLTPR